MKSITAMYKSFAAIIICIGCYFTALPAFADGWNYGFKLAYFEADSPNIDDPDNVGLLVGYDWVKNYGIVGIEADISTTFEDGKLAGQTVAVDTAGLFATYKTRGFSEQGLGYYLKIKGGVFYYDLSLGATNVDDTDFSYGLGLGVNMGDLVFEIDFTAVAGSETVEDSEMVSFTVLF